MNDNEASLYGDTVSAALHPSEPPPPQFTVCSRARAGCFNDVSSSVGLIQLTNLIFAIFPQNFLPVLIHLIHQCSQTNKVSCT